MDLTAHIAYMRNHVKMVQNMQVKANLTNF